MSTRDIDAFSATDRIRVAETRRCMFTLFYQIIAVKYLNVSIEDRVAISFAKNNIFCDISISTPNSLYEKFNVSRTLHKFVGTNSSKFVSQLCRFLIIELL